MPIPSDIEGNVDSVGTGDPGIDLVFEPVLRNNALHALHIPGEPITEIAAAPGKAKAALCAGRIERSIGTAHRPAFAERNLVIFGLWLRLRRGFLGDGFLLLFRFDLRVLALDID